MVKIIGVDFSGAKGDRDTWVTEAQLQDDKLLIECCRPTSRAGLENLLRDLPQNAVAAMDFPFSVPLRFARTLMGTDDFEMPALWSTVAEMGTGETGYKKFQCKVEEYLKKNNRREPLRICDLYSSIGSNLFYKVMQRNRGRRYAYSEK